MGRSVFAPASSKAFYFCPSASPHPTLWQHDKTIISCEAIMIRPEPRVAVGAGVSGHGCGRQQLTSARRRGRRGGKERSLRSCSQGMHVFGGVLYLRSRIRFWTQCVSLGAVARWLAVWVSVSACRRMCAVRAECGLTRRARVGSASVQSVRTCGVCKSRRGVCLYFYKATRGANV